MRALLVNIQVAVLLTMIFVSVLAGGGLASLTAVGAGVGPAAMAAGVYILTLFAAAVAGFAAFVLPVSLIAAASLLFAIAAGYRYLRWCRFLGVLANLIGIAYFVFLYLLVQIDAIYLLAALAFFPAVNGVLFLLIPRRPSIRLLRTAASVLIPLLYLVPTGVIALALALGKTELKTPSYIILAIALFLYGLPFCLAFRLVPETATPNWRLGVWLLALALVAALELLLVFPLGLPLAVATLLLLELAEARALYPDAMPPEGGVLYWTARTLGRLPEPSEAAVSQTAKRKETRSHEAIPESEPPPPDVPAAD